MMMIEIAASGSAASFSFDPRLRDVGRMPWFIFCHRLDCCALNVCSLVLSLHNAVRRSSFCRLDCSSSTHAMLGRSAAVVPSAGPNADLHHDVPTSTATTSSIKSSVPRDALVVVCIALRNCAGCAVILVVANAILAQGNYLSGQSQEVQSLASFTAATVAHFCVFVGISLTVYQATGLQRLRFADSPELTTSWTSCITRIARECWRSWVIWSSVTVGCCYALGSADPWYVCKAKVHDYIALVGFFMFVVSTDLAVRTIFQRDTVEGLAIGRINTHSYVVRLLRVLQRRPHVFIATLLATGFVHLSSRLVLSSRYLLPFSACSVGLKVSLQEMAKRFVLKHSGVDQRAVFLMVMLPTILVETQLRVALLRFQGVSVSFASAAVYVGLAAAKGVVRLAKVALVRRELLLHHSKRHSTGPRNANTGITMWVSQAPPPSGDDSRARQVKRWRSARQVIRWRSSKRMAMTYTHNLSLWKDRRMLYHAAEILADMHAEYIAIACALSVHSIYGGHRKYSLEAVRFSWPSTSAVEDGVASLSAMSLLAQMALQVAVDLVCCMVELKTCIPLHKSTMPKLVVTVSILMTNLTLGMCAIGYIDSER